MMNKTKGIEALEERLNETAAQSSTGLTVAWCADRSRRVRLEDIVSLPADAPLYCSATLFVASEASPAARVPSTCDYRPSKWGSAFDYEKIHRGFSYVEVGDLQVEDVYEAVPFLARATNGDAQALLDVTLRARPYGADDDAWREISISKVSILLDASWWKKNSQPAGLEFGKWAKRQAKDLGIKNPEVEVVKCLLAGTDLEASCFKYDGADRRIVLQ